MIGGVVVLMGSQIASRVDNFILGIIFTVLFAFFLLIPLIFVLAMIEVHIFDE